MKRVLYTWIVLVLLFLAMVLCGITLGRAATTSKQHNSLGAITYQTNPYEYIVIDKVLDVQNIDGNLNLRVHPIWTYMLFDQTILFCGLPVDKFRGIAEPFAVTYERQAHRSVQGIGCHDILKVDAVKVAGEKVDE